jgi:transcriptional regulator with XRE-family HTH domain
MELNSTPDGVDFVKWVKAEALKELREAKGWSQKQLAEVSGLSQQAIAHWELGDREPSATNLFALCRALGVSCERFATEGPPPTEPTPARPKGRPKGDPADSTAAEKKPAPRAKGKKK